MKNTLSFQETFIAEKNVDHAFPHTNKKQKTNNLQRVTPQEQKYIHNYSLISKLMLQFLPQAILKADCINAPTKICPCIATSIIFGCRREGIAAKELNYRPKNILILPLTEYRTERKKQICSKA